MMTTDDGYDYPRLTKTKHIIVTGMDCASCAQNIATGVDNLNGVDSCALSFTTGKLRVQGDIPAETIVKRVRDLGYDVVDPDTHANNYAQLNGLAKQPASGLICGRRHETQLALLAAFLLLPGLLFHELLPGLGFRHWLIDVLAITAMLVAGYPVARSAWRSLRINHTLDMNVLMTIAAIGAVLIGAYVEAALIMVLFSLGEAMEGYTANRARESIRSLMEIAPHEATVMRPCMDCSGHLGQNGYTGGPCPFCGLEPHQVPVEELAIGETIVS